MRKILCLCFLSGFFYVSAATSRMVVKPFVEGKGLRGWVIDSIQMTDKKTFVYGHLVLSKGFTAYGSVDNYIEVPSTGKRYKQTDLKGELPIFPKQLEGTGQKVRFIEVYPALPANTKLINITEAGFDGKGAAWYGVWLTPRTTVFTDKLAHLQKLEGNWFSQDGSGVWKAGFYEKKVFWNNGFWDFKVLKTTETSAALELTNKESKKCTLEISTPAIDVLQLNDGQKETKLIKKISYAQADNSMFKTGFYAADSITVSGYYQVVNPVFSKQVALLVNDLFAKEPIVYPIKVSQDGLFSVKVPMKNTAKVAFSNQLGPLNTLSQINFMVEPGDNIILTYRNEKEKEVVFAGGNHRFNNEYQAFLAANPYFVSKKKLNEKLTSNANKFVEWRKGEHAKLQTAYLDWQKKNITNSKLNDVVASAIKYGYAADMLLAKVFLKEALNLDSIIPQATDTAYYNNPTALYSEYYPEFLKRYKLISSAGQNPTLKEIVNCFSANAYLTEDEKSILANLKEMDTSSKAKEDVDKFKAFITDNGEKLNALFFKNQDLITKLREEKSEEAKKKFAIPAGVAMDYIVANTMYEALLTGERTLTPTEMGKLKEECLNPDFQDIVLRKNAEVEKSLQTLRGQKLPENVHVHEIPANVTDLTGYIAKQFKGKVIYLDFWATWCGPCKTEMPLSKQKKAEFKGKDVVFFYLTGAISPEIAWQKQISDIPGDHIRLTAEQWNAIAKQYNVATIPHYMLIDKKGNVVDKNAPRPSSGAQLQEAIKKLL